MLWGKSNRSHFPAHPQRQVPGCVGTSLWARSASHTRAGKLELHLHLSALYPLPK